MKIELAKFSLHQAQTGYIATFDVNLDIGISLRGIHLCQPEHKPGEAWLVIPSLARENRQAVGMSPAIRKLIGDRAVLMYEAATGTKLTFTPPPSAVVAPETDEPEDAGLRRVLCASVEDGLRQVAA